jgi:hypothetical protein
MAGSIIDYEQEPSPSGANSQRCSVSDLFISCILATLATIAIMYRSCLWFFFKRFDPPPLREGALQIDRNGLLAASAGSAGQAGLQLGTGNPNS